MTHAFLNHLSKETADLKEAGLFKNERIIASPQEADIQISDGSHVLNFCANNYLGLANHPVLIKAAQAALKKYGFGLSSVRFICGTQTIHKQLEDQIRFFSTRLEQLKLK